MGASSGVCLAAGEQQPVIARILVVLCIAGPLCATDSVTLTRDLDLIARVATVMVDGDLCQRIVTDRAAKYMVQSDPRDPYADADNYDVDDQAFISVKKTLIRLAGLVEYPVDVNLWLPVPEQPSQIQVVIRNRYEMSQFWIWGKLRQDMPSPMRTCLQTGKRVVVRDKPGYVSVLAPVRNSMGDTIGLVEAVSKETPDARENVK